MGRSKQYTVAGRVFERQADLETAVKLHLNGHPLNERFFDPFLAAVVNEHHAEVIAAGQRATGWFEYLDYGEQLKRGMLSAERFRGGKIVLGLFEPLDEWRDVTVYPWRGRGNHRLDIKRALREKIAGRLPKPSAWDRCRRQPCDATGFDLEYEHVEPTFDVIAERCLMLMDEREIAARFGYSKFAPGRDQLADLIPDSHPAVALLMHEHEGNAWEWLCKRHHRNVGEPDAINLALAL